MFRKAIFACVALLLTVATAFSQSSDNNDEVSGKASFTFSDVTEKIENPTFQVGPVILSCACTDKATKKPTADKTPRLVFSTENSITFSLSDETYYIQEIIITQRNDSKNFATLNTENGLLYQSDPKDLVWYWYCQNDRAQSITITKSIYGNQESIYISRFDVYYRKKGEKSPAPQVTNHDKKFNTVTLSVFDNGKDVTNKSEILYGVSSLSTSIPICSSVYTGSIDLREIAIGDDMTYLWAQAVVGDNDFSDITLIFPFKYSAGNSNPGITYHEVTGNFLTENHWYIITAKPTNNGPLRVLTKKSTDGSNDSTFDLPSNGILGVTIDDFESSNVLEFQYVNNQLIEKKTGLPLLPDSPATRSSDNSTGKVEFKNENGSHTLTVDGQKLGYDNFKFVFNTDSEIPIKLYTTGADKNTGIDQVAEDTDNDSEIHFYNLQGIEVANPVNGLYIKRQGNKTSKVIIR